MKTFAATFALIGFTSAIGIREEETAGLDLADLGNVFRVAQHICLDDDADAYSGEERALQTAAEQEGLTAEQGCDALLGELGEDDGTELAQTETELIGGMVMAVAMACTLWC